MATRYKVLGQVAPAATTNATLYTAPAFTETIISTLIIANRSSSLETFRIAVRPSGAAISDEHYIAYDVSVGAGDSTTLTLGITLASSDVVGVYASSANLSFSAYGTEIDI